MPDSINGILPSPTWLCYEKVNMYLYDGTDGNRHLFYASDARSTEALLELADELGTSQIGFWHFNSVVRKCGILPQSGKRNNEIINRPCK